jgi:hypothetical protein
MHLLLSSMILLSVLAGPSTKEVVQDAHKEKDGNSAQGQAKIEKKEGSRIAGPEEKQDTQDSGNRHQAETKDRVPQWSPKTGQ